MRAEIKREIKTEIDAVVSPLRRSLRMWNEMMPNTIDLATDDDFLDISDESTEETDQYSENLNAVNDDEIPTTSAVALVNL